MRNHAFAIIFNKGIPMFEQTQWQPSASIKNLLTRAKLIEEIRRFFTDRGLL